MRFAFIATEKACYPVALMCLEQAAAGATHASGSNTGTRGGRDRRKPRPLWQSAGTC